MHHCFIIGVAGGSGSGKSTVTKHIVEAIGSENVAVIMQDYYYNDLSNLTVSQRNNINFDHPDALDLALMKKQLNDLYHGLPVHIPEYDFTQHMRLTTTKLVLPAKVIIVEGIFALYDEDICNQMSLRIFVDTAADIRLMRRLRRDLIERNRTLESVIKQYTQFVRPMYQKFVEPTKRKAHIIIPHGSNKAALEMIVSRIQSVLNGQQINVDAIIPCDDDTFDV